MARPYLPVTCMTIHSVLGLKACVDSVGVTVAVAAYLFLLWCILVRLEDRLLWGQIPHLALNVFPLGGFACWALVDGMVLCHGGRRFTLL